MKTIADMVAESERMEAEIRQVREAPLLGVQPAEASDEPEVDSQVTEAEADAETDTVSESPAQPVDALDVPEHVDTPAVETDQPPDATEPVSGNEAIPGVAEAVEDTEPVQDTVETVAVDESPDVVESPVEPLDGLPTIESSDTPEVSQAQSDEVAAAETLSDHPSTRTTVASMSDHPAPDVTTVMVDEAPSDSVESLSLGELQSADDQTEGMQSGMVVQEPDTTQRQIEQSDMVDHTATMSYEQQVDKQMEFQQRSNEDFIKQLGNELAPAFDSMRDHQRMAVHQYVDQQQLMAQYLGDY